MWQIEFEIKKISLHDSENNERLKERHEYYCEALLATMREKMTTLDPNVEFVEVGEAKIINSRETVVASMLKNISEKKLYKKRKAT